MFLTYMSKEQKEQERKEHVAHEQVGNRRQEQETGTGWTRTAVQQETGRGDRNRLNRNSGRNRLHRKTRNNRIKEETTGRGRVVLVCWLYNRAIICLSYRNVVSCMLRRHGCRTTAAERRREWPRQGCSCRTWTGCKTGTCYTGTCYTKLFQIERCCQQKNLANRKLKGEKPDCDWACVWIFLLPSSSR